MRRLTSQVVALERANDIVDEKLSATARLERVQRLIDEELAWAVQEARRDGGDRSALADVILKLAAEVRQQLGLQLSISRTLVDLRIVKEFHQTVVEAIREESPETARRIVAGSKNGEPSGRMSIFRHSLEVVMPIWRDPLDELIADLDQSTPGTTTPTFEMPPPMEDYCFAAQWILSRDPAERQRLAADPAVKRVMDYYDRLARARQSSGLVNPTG